MYKIYCYTSPNNKKYIGVTKTSLSQRAGKNGIYYKNCRLFYNAIQKYGFCNFKSEILYYTDNFKEAEQVERFYIAKFKTTNSKFGYNLESGGNYNKQISKETREKISKTLSGKPSCRLGKKQTEETKNKISKAHIGRKNTALHNKHIAEANMRKIKCVETNTCFSSIKEAAQVLKGSSAGIVYSCKQGVTYKGFHFEYI